MILSVYHGPGGARSCYPWRVARACKRTRIALKVTVEVAGAGAPVLATTRDISATGLFIETGHTVARGAHITLSLLDEERGEALSVDGEVMRVVTGCATVPAGLGIRLLDPPEFWPALVERAHPSEQGTRQRRPPRRLRVLVVGEEVRRRGALALYIQSGWDVRFASDVDSGLEALQHIRIDAVVAEQELTDDRWLPVLERARATQPRARRIVRASLHGNPMPGSGLLTGLVDRIVDHEAGLDAVVESLATDE